MKQPEPSNLNAPDLPSLIIGEILLLQDCYLENIPGGGKGIMLNKNHALLWSNRQTYKLVQGDWVPVSPDKIPLADYLKALRESLANRSQMLKTRIEKLQRNLYGIESLTAVSDPAKLAELLRRAASLRSSTNLGKISARDRA